MQWGGWANSSSYLEGSSRADRQQKCRRELALRQLQRLIDEQHLLGHLSKWLDLYSKELRLERKSPG